MNYAVAIAIANVIVSLSVSAGTLYFAWLRWGRLRMTRPALVFLVFNPVSSRKLEAVAKFEQRGRYDER